MRKAMLSALGMAVLIYAAFIGAMYMNQRNMQYLMLPTKFDVSQSQLPDTREITVTTKDGLNITGWYSPPKNDSFPTIVRLHGNGNNVLWNMNAMLPYAQKGYGALSVEYRGYSGNPGRPTEQGLYEDGRAFINWLIDNGTPEEKIIIHGESLGTGVAVQMALEHPKIHTLILQAPFSSMTEAAGIHYWYVPVKWLLKDRYENLAKIPDIKMPLIVAHGTADNIVPYILGKKLFEAAPEPKTLITIEGGNHSDMYKFGVNEKILSALSE